MRYQTVQEILDHAQKLHTVAAEQALSAASSQADARLEAILDYLAEHQTRLARAIDEYRQDASEATLSTWFDRTPPSPSEGLDDSILANSRTTDDLLDQVTAFHDEVVALYANLRDQARSESVRQVFGDLASIERHEAMELVQSTRQLDDI